MFNLDMKTCWAGIATPNGKCFSAEIKPMAQDTYHVGVMDPQKREKITTKEPIDPEMVAGYIKHAVAKIDATVPDIDIASFDWHKAEPEALITLRDK